MASSKKSKFGKYQVFIGSSSEALPIVSLISEKLIEQSRSDPDGLVLEPEPWNNHFREEAVMSSTFLDAFPDLLDKCEFSIFILSPDDTLIKRDEVKKFTRDNVWFEAGMFMGRRGKDQTFFFLNTNDFGRFHFPSDIAGYTIQGASWDTSIAELYFQKGPPSKLFEKHPTVKDAVSNKITNGIDDYIKLIFKKVKSVLNEKTQSEEVIVITDRKKCFDIGIDLVKAADVRLYTTIGFSKSLQSPTKMEKDMQSALEEKIKGKVVDFRRYLKTDISGIKKQYDFLQKVVDDNIPLISEPFLYDCQFDYLELIISDDNVLMVFPDYRPSSKVQQEKVAFGFWIKENTSLADVLSEWLMKKVCK